MRNTPLRINLYFVLYVEEVLTRENIVISGLDPFYIVVIQSDTILGRL